MSYLAIIICFDVKTSFFSSGEKCFYHCDEVTSEYCNIYFERKVCWICFEIRYRNTIAGNTIWLELNWRGANFNTTLSNGNRYF